MSKFDAAALAPSAEAFEFEIYNPMSKQGTGMFITVYGKDSDTYREIQRGQQNKRFKILNRRSVGGLQVTAEEVETEAVELLVACTKSWRDVTFHGEELKCSPDTVRDLYTSVPVIREQVDEAVHDRANFMKR